MTRSFKLGAIAAAAFIAAPAFAAASLDANLELDTTYYSKNADRLQQGGRVEVNVSGKKELGGAYVAAKGTAILNKAGAASVDDMWVEGGNSAMAVKLGRFEAADLFPAGKDTLVIGGITYGANGARGRKGAADPHVALTANLGAGAALEVGVIETASAGQKTDIGVRPVVSFGAGPVTVKLGFDKIKNGQTVAATDQNKMGVGATLGGTFGGVGLNVNVASRDKENSFGVNATVGAFGVGFNAGKSLNSAATAVNKVNAIYAAYSVPFFVDGATATFAVANGKNNDGVKDTGVRLRVNYGF